MRARSVGLIILCQVASMTLWFSASAAIPGLLAAGSISGQQASWLTGAVQLGFVAGTLTSALFGLPDRLDPRRVFALGAGLGAGANACLLATGFAGVDTIALRFATGFCLAGVYPVGMKLAAGWAVRRLGMMIGALVAALTLGSALPSLFNAVLPLDWRLTVVASSVLALAAALGIGFVALGPNHVVSARFIPGDVARALRRRSVRLVNLGYLGHMWELYAMWAWIGPFLAWALAGRPVSTPLLAFLVIAVGALGCLGAGELADRLGRTSVTMGAMGMSGLCALAIGPAAGLGMGAVLTVALVWGVTVIADSAKFSAAITELSDPPLVGTMLTVQTCLGFLLTFFAIQAMPLVVTAIGWRYAFSVLAVGPAIGTWAMWRVRAEPDAGCIAKGIM